MMLATLKTEGLQTLEEIRAFLDGSEPLGFETPHRGAAYGFVGRQIERDGPHHRSPRCTRPDVRTPLHARGQVLPLIEKRRHDLPRRAIDEAGGIEEHLPQYPFDEPRC
jgi:hypothetical protein